MSLRIDRPTFLALTFGMTGAATACNTGPGPAVSANVVDIPRQPPQPPPSASPPKTAKIDERPAPEHHDDDDDDEMPTAEDEDFQRCGWVDAASVTRPAGACNDGTGTAPSCNTLPSCSGFAFPKTECEMYRRTYKPKVAQRAIECLNKLGAKKLCSDACSVYRCADRALKSACPDASVENACKQILASCKTASLPECRQYLAGLNAMGRAKMISCMTTGCAAGLYSCAEGL